MPTPRDYSRIIANINSLGLTDLANKMLGGLRDTEELHFGDLRRAKSVRTLLYHFLWFHPAAKAQVSMRLNEDIGTLTIKPRGISEKRGRKGGKR